MKRLLAALFGIAFVIWATAVPAQDSGGRLAAGPQGPEQGQYRRQLWLVPSQDKSVLMRTALFRPQGAGPFPLAVINHGSVANADQRRNFVQPLFAVAAEFFVRRGYAVIVPQRPGHGETGGPYFEGQDGPCENADYVKSGSTVADSIQAAIDYMTRQSFVKRDGVIVVGQSAGGWGTLALAGRNPKNVKAIIAFAAGRGGRVHGRPNNNCAPEKLIAAAGVFGSTARIPVLSIYTQNDSYFSPALSQQLAAAYRKAGGNMDYRLLPAFGDDGHRLFGAREGVTVWAPVVDELLNGQRRQKP
jgi:dienelactone hydrolase